MTKKYKPGSAWKRSNWDKWSFWKKVRHCIAVPLGLITIMSMFCIAVYLVFVIFGVYGFMLHIRDTILLGIMHEIFG